MKRENVIEGVKKKKRGEVVEDSSRIRRSTFLTEVTLCHSFGWWVLGIVCVL
jgi:hypothetical protein